MNTRVLRSSRLSVSYLIVEYESFNKSVNGYTYLDSGRIFVYRLLKIRYV